MQPFIFRRLLPFSILFFLLAATAHSLDFGATVNPPAQTIRINETARFSLTITNPSDQVEQFEIYSPDVQWDIATDPSSDRLLKIRPEGTATAHLIVRPLYVNPGLYIVGLITKRSGTNDLVRKDLEIGITRDAPGEYAPSIRTTLDFSDDLDPRQNATLKISIENQNRRDVGDITIKIRSALINEDISSHLSPFESKQLTRTYSLGSYLPPQQDTLRISIFAQWRNRTVQFDAQPYPFHIIEFGGIDEKAETDSMLAASTTSIRLTNRGNTQRTKIYKERVNLLQQWMMTANPDPQVRKTAEGTFYIWNINLDPGQEVTLTTTENYRPLIYLVLVIVVFILGYYYLRTPLFARKAAMVVETREGGISELKVLITLVNRSTSQLRDVLVVDRVPSIADLKPDHEIGTLRPTHVLKHEAQGTQLRWDLESLDPHEERILSYKIRTKLSVLGGLNLPPARLSFKQYGYGRGTVSNMENLFGGH